MAAEKMDHNDQNKGQQDDKKQKVIAALNEARAKELYAIMQYMNQHYQLDDKDYGELAKKIRKISIDEMKHAEWLAERIKDLDGEPTARIDGNVIKGQRVEDIYSFNEDLEDRTIDDYNRFVKICRENDDQVSANLIQKIIDEEQEHTNYFKDIDEHITSLGDLFLARMAASGKPD